MNTIRSRDGTAIAYARSGRGPPLVLVHGTSADHTRWKPVLPQLEERFTVHAVDRRGRGESGDAARYAIEREFEDVAAVVDAIGEPAHLLGHSYGAVCSLEAALRTPSVRRLVLYEPPLPAEVERDPSGLVERLDAMLARGDREGVVATFFQEAVRTPPAELAALKSLPNWPARLAAAHTIPRELRAGYVFQPERFAPLRIPTLLLLGGDSPPRFRNAAERIRAAVATSRMAVMPGQQHAAMNTAPEMFLREVLAFLAEP